MFAITKHSFLKPIEKETITKLYVHVYNVLFSGNMLEIILVMFGYYRLLKMMQSFVVFLLY